MLLTQKYHHNDGYHVCRRGYEHGGRTTTRGLRWLTADVISDMFTSGTQQSKHETHIDNVETRRKMKQGNGGYQTSPAVCNRTLNSIYSLL